MAIVDHINGDQAEITLSDRFTFSDSTEFRKKLFDAFDRKVRSLSINVADLTFMDSSGLGMFIVANNECQSRNISMSLRHPSGDVKSLLQMTKSYERFKIID